MVADEEGQQRGGDLLKVLVPQLTGAAQVTQV